MFIDSHAHLEYPDFEGELDEVVRRAKSSGVEKIINVGTTVENSKKSLRLAKKYKGIIFASAGLHPHDIDEAIGVDHQLKEITKLIQNKEVVAVGECGLDYSRIIGDDKSVDVYEAKAQKILFTRQLDIALKHNYPIIVHSRIAEDDTFEILSQKKYKGLKGVIHCYTGSKGFAEKVLKLGFYIGFTGIITFPKAEEVRLVAKEAPLEKILIETDCPFIAPVPYRGQRNESSYVIEVAKMIAEVKDISLDKVAEVTTKNVESLFGI